MDATGAGGRGSAGSRFATGPPPATRPNRRGASSAGGAGVSAGAGSTVIFLARDGRAGRGAGASSGAGTGFETGGSMDGNSCVDEVADFRATFLTAAFLAVAFFAGGASSADAGLGFTLLVARLRAGGVSPAVSAGGCGMVS